MFILKLAGKILLLPVWLILFVIGLAVKMTVQTYAVVRGILGFLFTLLIIATAYCYHDWVQVAFLFVLSTILYPQYLAGFIRINTSGALITMETENYQIDGKKGNWIATDTIIIDGKQFYLMEHQVYRDQAQGVILDAYGKMVVEECKKFDEKTKQKIHNYIQQQAPLNSVEQLKQDGQIRLEHYQKFYQNGTYERSRESGTEANYDMVDGLVNNQKRNQEKTFDARSNKQTSRNEQDNKPKKRRSVIKRLHQKQIAIARRSGKPIPKYLDQEMERKRG